MTDGRTTPEDAPDEDAEPPRGLALRMALPAAGFYLAWSGLAVAVPKKSRHVPHDTITVRMSR